MNLNEPCSLKELTSEQLVGLLSALPEDATADHDRSKRHCSRWMLTAPTELHFVTQDGTSTGQHVEIHDISLMGIGLLAKAPIPEATRALLVLPLPDGTCAANVHVAHCTPSPEGYRVGCRLLLPDLPAIIPRSTPTPSPKTTPTSWPSDPLPLPFAPRPRLASRPLL